jgi:hypothetical protein
MLVDMCGLPDVLLEARARRAAAPATVAQETVAVESLSQESVAHESVAQAAEDVEPVAVRASPAAAEVDVSEPAREPEPIHVVAIPVESDDLAIPIEAATVVATAPAEPQLELFG